eukprot:CAMPEP_0172660546 /NCGR_PEP_ID=MMETSP1074-20121228/4126_1 /TAXON_ID=2916 /ORGANISM="Ceratium fusus, Strain PA161109" /LENGTH=230 /DNA_ID=CAMNT_0013476175 /DNA_START=50 /DNA_END=742 /DNA_ORIENTATION=+
MADVAANQAELDRPQTSDLPHEIQVQTSWASLLEPGVMATDMHQPDGREIYLVSGSFTAKECEALLTAAEKHGFGATNYPKSYRGNFRLITTDESLSAAMWERLRPFVPETVECDGNVWEACGLNECWRLSKYHPGDRFKRHCDANFLRDSREMSMLTVNIYMNSDFEGGSTRFFPDGRAGAADLTIQPEPGLCLLFRQPPVQDYYHDGEEVQSGLKYLFRSDVVYRLRE